MSKSLNMPDDFILDDHLQNTRDTNEDNYRKEVRLLCYNIFEKNTSGKRLLHLLEQRYLTEAIVADPDGNPNRAYYREGQRETIRMFSHYINWQKKILEGEKHE